MHLGPFGCLTKFGAKRAEVVQKFVPCSRVRMFRNEQTLSTLLDPYLMFRCISYYLVAFGTVCCITTLSSKWAKLVQKFVPRSRVGIFRNERSRSTPLDSKLMFWCVLYYLGAFRTIYLPYKTQCKTGWSGAKVRAMKSCRNFSQRTHLIHPIGPLPHVSVHFVLFGWIWDSLLHYNTQFKMGQTCAKVRATKSRRNFSQRTHPIHPIGL